MHTDPALQQALRLLVGEEVYNNKVLQKQVLATFLLAGEANKQALNDIVHPAVAQDFERSGYEWLESAILFDSGFNRRLHFDRVVCVTAPLEVRVQRIMLRDHLARKSPRLDRQPTTAGRGGKAQRLCHRQRRTCRPRSTDRQLAFFADYAPPYQEDKPYTINKEQEQWKQF